MRKLFGVKSVLFVITVLLCFSSYAERSLKTPIKLKFAIGGHSVFTTTIDSKFLIHHEEKITENKDDQSSKQDTKSTTERVFIHIEGEIVPINHRSNSYAIRVQGRIEMNVTENRFETSKSHNPSIPDTRQIKSTHENREMELLASTHMKAGQKKTLASKDGFDVELRIEEDND